MAEKQSNVLIALVAAAFCYVGYMHPSTVPALGLAAAVWVAMSSYMKE